MKIHDKMFPFQILSFTLDFTTPL